MAKTMLQKRLCSNQAVFSREGRKMESLKPFDYFVDGIIREYGKWNVDDYELDAKDLDQNVLRLFLPYVLESDELDDLEQNPHLANVYLKEHLEYIQECIDSRCFEVFKEAMEEMDYYMRYHADNGEPYFIRRY